MYTLVRLTPVLDDTFKTCFENKTEFIIRGHILMIPPLKFAIIELKGDRLASGNIN